MLNSKEAELIAVFGRRRIGKTFLIRNYYQQQLVFECTGTSFRAMNSSLIKNMPQGLTTSWQSLKIKQKRRSSRQ